MNKVQKIWVVRHYIGKADPKWIEYYKTECSEHNSFVDVNGVYPNGEVKHFETYVFSNREKVDAFINDISEAYTNEEWNNLVVNFIGTNNENLPDFMILWIEPNGLATMFDCNERPLY